jgi:hypothetical protein
MALELYVLPLASYLAGAFERPPTASDDEFVRDKPKATAVEARARVEAIMDSLGEAAGTPVRWQDSGEVAAAERFDPRGLHAVRAYAAHLELPQRRWLFLRSFVLPRDPREHPSLQRIYQGANTRYVHLMRHSDNKGFFAPPPFAAPVESCEAQWWKVGSAAGLVAELDELAARLQAGEGQVPVAVRPAIEGPLATLRRLAGLAVARDLPLVFDG